MAFFVTIEEQKERRRRRLAVRRDAPQPATSSGHSYSSMRSKDQPRQQHGQPLQDFRSQSSSTSMGKWPTQQPRAAPPAAHIPRTTSQKLKTTLRRREQEIFSSSDVIGSGPRHLRFTMGLPPRRSAQVQTSPYTRIHQPASTDASESTASHEPPPPAYQSMESINLH